MTSLAVLARGDRVEVHRARRGDTTVIVALADGVDRDADARFRDEVRALDAALRGPGYVDMEGVWIVPSRAIAHREVEGRPLLAGTRSLLETAALLDPIARLLGRAHSRGVGDGALAPERIVLTDKGAVLPDLLFAATLGLPRVPAYSAPEQLDARETNVARADVYALALLFLAVASGGTPWLDERELYVRASDRRKRPSLTSLGIAAAISIDRVLERALAVDAELRFENADTFWDALRTAVLAAPGTDVEPPLPKIVEPTVAPRSTPARAPMHIVVGISVGVIAIGFGAEALVSALRKPASPIAPSVNVSARPSVSAAPSPSPSVVAVAKAPEVPPDMVSAGTFFVDRTEVTVKSYRACVAASVCAPTHKHTSGYDENDPVRREWRCNFHRTERDDHPINCVSFPMATKYCAHVGKRLPTGAEWTHAARGDTARKYPWGDNGPRCKEVVFARYGPNNPGCSKQPIGTQPAASHPLTASPFGALDMAGSLWEWTTDKSARGLPILRGGAWDSAEPGLTVESKLEQSPGNADLTLGFRCVKDADQ